MADLGKASNLLYEIRDLALHSLKIKRVDQAFRQARQDEKEKTEEEHLFECSGCGKEIWGEPCLYYPPDYNSPDGLGHAYCHPCSEQRDLPRSEEIRMAVQEERRRCAEISEQFFHKPNLKLHGAMIAQAIRERRI